MACKSVLQGARYLVLHSLSFALFPFDQKFRPVWKFPLGNGTIISSSSGVVPKFSKISCPKFLYHLFFISEFSVKLFSFGIHVTNFRIFRKLSDPDSKVPKVLVEWTASCGNSRVQRWTRYWRKFNLNDESSLYSCLRARFSDFKVSTVTELVT